MRRVPNGKQVVASLLGLIVVSLIAATVVSGYHMRTPFLSMRASKDGSRETRQMWVSNDKYHITLLRFEIPEGKWRASLCLECTGPTNKLPLRVEAWALTTSWGYLTNYDDLIDERVLWTDGYDFYFDGPGWQCMDVTATVDYWQQVKNRGLVLQSATHDPYSTAGRTYRFRQAILHLRAR